MNALTPCLANFPLTVAAASIAPCLSAALTAACLNRSHDLSLLPASAAALFHSLILLLTPSLRPCSCMCTANLSSISPCVLPSDALTAACLPCSLARPFSPYHSSASSAAILSSLILQSSSSLLLCPCAASLLLAAAAATIAPCPSDALTAACLKRSLALLFPPASVVDLFHSLTLLLTPSLKLCSCMCTANLSNTSPCVLPSDALTAACLNRSLARPFSPASIVAPFPSLTLQVSPSLLLCPCACVPVPPSNSLCASLPCSLSLPIAPSPIDVAEGLGRPLPPAPAPLDMFMLPCSACVCATGSGSVRVRLVPIATASIGSPSCDVPPALGRPS